MIDTLLKNQKYLFAAIFGGFLVFFPIVVSAHS